MSRDPSATFGGRRAGKTAQLKDQVLQRSHPRAEKTMIVITADPNNIPKGTQAIIDASRAAGYRVDVIAQQDKITGKEINFAWWEEDGIATA